MDSEKKLGNDVFEITKNSEENLFGENKILDLQKELLDKANSVEFIGGLFNNMIDPPFKVFLKRIILKKYFDEISVLIKEENKDLDIYSDTNDKIFKNFIIKKAENNGIKDEDYLFDSTSLNIKVTTRICFGEVYKSDRKEIQKFYKEKGLERQKKPISRENAFFLVFALNLSLTDLNELLMKGLKQQSVIFKNPYEVISWWALKSSVSVKFDKFKELKTFIIGIDSNKSDYINTNYYQNIAENLNTEEELKEYLRSLSGWKRQKIKGKTNGEKIVISQSKRAKEIFLCLYKQIKKVKSDIKNQPAYQIQRKLISDEMKFDLNKIEIEKARDSKQRLKENHKLTPMIEKKIEDKIERLEYENDLIDIVGPEICWEDLAKTRWLEYKIYDEDVLKNLSEELYGDSSNALELKNKKFQILNRTSLRIRTIDDIIQGDKEISRDHLMIMAFYYYVSLLENNYYANWVGDSGYEHDDCLINTYPNLPTWYYIRKRRGVLDDKELFFDFKDVADEFLRKAGFNTVYLPNSMDSFIFMCLLASDPISCFRRFINLEI